MKSLLLLSALVLPLAAQESIERLDPALDAIIAPDAKIETLASGYQWAEGPLWDDQNKRLLFSDVPRNTIYQWREGDEEATVWMKPSGFTGVTTDSREPGSNGLAFDNEGRVLFCEHGDRRVSVLTENGGKLTLADHYDGKRFNSPNDLAVHSSGAIYFTDPPYGLPGGQDSEARELDINGVYRIAPDGEVTLLIDDLDRPNGVALGPDEKTLYVAQSHGPAPIIMSYPVNDDGSVGEGSLFYDCKGLEGPGSPDGLKIGDDGTVFSTGPGGLLIIDKEGKLLGRILCTRATANVGFGKNAEGGNALYLTSKDRILRVNLAR